MRIPNLGSPTQDGARVAVLGGDRREMGIASAFLSAGWNVMTFGCIEEGVAGRHAVSVIEEALQDATVIVTPAPGMAEDGSLYAPHAPSYIALSPDLLKEAAPGVHLFAGSVQQWLREGAEALGAVICEFARDDALQVIHAIPTAEGAIAETVRNYDGTINGCEALVVGYGRIAVVLARLLRAMGAEVTVAARRAEIRARAHADGHHSCGTSPRDLARVGKTMELVYTTAPARLLTDEVLAHLRENVFLLDLASPPGGLDHESAPRRELRVVWARGQAGTAPIHSGQAQSEFIGRVLREARKCLPPGV